MGIGASGIVAINAMRSLNREPSWCEKNNCKCPCHAPLEGSSAGETIAAVIFVVLFFLVIIWLMVTGMQWLFLSDGHNLWNVLKDQWHWLTSLRLW